MIGIAKDLFIAREKIGHDHQAEKARAQEQEKGPDLLETARVGRRLIFKNAKGLGRLARQLECLPDFLAVSVFADGPRGFARNVFARKHRGRTYEIRHGGVLSYAHLPREFSDDIVRVGVRSLKMPICLSKIIGRGTS